jgi:hypothetical protein
MKRFLCTENELPRMVAIVALVGMILACIAGPGSPAREPAPQTAESRMVYLAGRLADEDLIALTTAVAAAEPPTVVLLDTPGVRAHLKNFLTA